MPIYKVKTSEIDGVELEFETEVLLSIQNISNESPVFDAAEGVNLAEVLDWVRNNAKTRLKKFFPEQIITVPSGDILQMHSPQIDGELFVDGEVYIL